MAIKKIISVKIGENIYPYVQNKDGFKLGVVCYDDAGTIKEVPVSKVTDFITE